MPPTNKQHSTDNPSSSSFEPDEFERLRRTLQRRLGPEYISHRQGPGAGMPSRCTFVPAGALTNTFCATSWSTGGKVTYIEGFTAFNLANEIFGFNGWSSSVMDITIDFVDSDNGRISIGVSVVIRVTLKDGSYHEVGYQKRDEMWAATVMCWDVGYGSMENAKNKANAFEKAKKEATTDALKRTLRTFGNVLGNCVYDKKYCKDILKVNNPALKFQAEDLYRHPQCAAPQQSPIPSSSSSSSMSNAMANKSAPPNRAGTMNGMNGGALNGMNGRVVNGMNGSTVNGMNGGAVNGVNGGAVNGVNGGSVNGMNGGSVVKRENSIDAFEGKFRDICECGPHVNGDFGADNDDAMFSLFADSIESDRGVFFDEDNESGRESPALQGGTNDQIPGHRISFSEGSGMTANGNNSNGNVINRAPQTTMGPPQGPVMKAPPPTSPDLKAANNFLTTPKFGTTQNRQFIPQPPVNENANINPGGSGSSNNLMGPPTTNQPFLNSRPPNLQASSSANQSPMTNGNGSNNTTMVGPPTHQQQQQLPNLFTNPPVALNMPAPKMNQQNYFNSREGQGQGQGQEQRQGQGKGKGKGKGQGQDQGLYGGGEIVTRGGVGGATNNGHSNGSSNVSVGRQSSPVGGPPPPTNSSMLMPPPVFGNNGEVASKGIKRPQSTEKLGLGINAGTPAGNTDPWFLNVGGNVGADGMGGVLLNGGDGPTGAMKRLKQG
ncbi:hypothetical protein BC936DRAFT_137719 [Jimgerdemannia flammicorona]|uniref:Rad52/22 family double-strand break repair protein-domain-containing protein n=1 Tax=Jimgerdemannia flammicorona TaxID=994334 RepID=A0A433DIV1_9FUNG|nr:hypothetical protein BC936DRAFT_137719 [Jimgerdemannia flammicorona]